jgi:hypothetical protein
MAQKTRKYNKRTTLRKRQSKRNFRKKKSKRNVGKKQSKRNGRKTIKRGGAAAEERGTKRPVEENSVTNHPNMPTEEDRGAENGKKDTKKKAKIYTSSGRLGILSNFELMRHIRIDPMAAHTVLINELKLFPKDYWRIMGASKELKGDKEFMMKAVKINGMALEYASDELKEDEELVRTAIATTPQAKELAGPRMYLRLQKEYESQLPKN